MKSGLSRVLNFSRQNQTPSFHLHLHLLNAPLFLAAAPESASEDLDSLFFVFFIVGFFSVEGFQWYASCLGNNLIDLVAVENGENEWLVQDDR
ncbi:hypothetical protein SDJN02_26273, partial [Cucurbita argyrosperma subsp. argyrosperma]